MTAYGFWLPNDPRGSWSDFVGAWEFYKFGGAATKTNERRNLAHDPHDVDARRKAKHALKYLPVRFDAVQRQSIADGFATAVGEAGYEISACCIGFDHIHAVVMRHERSIERIAGHLKSKATMALPREGVHPLREHRTSAGKTPSLWGEGIWSVFINNHEHFSAAIRYVEDHPTKEGLALQRWGFVRALRV